MTLVVIGPVTKDLVVIGDERSHKVGGATYFQSFVFEEFYDDYLAIVNCSDESLADEFPDSKKVRVILKDDTHFFVNKEEKMITPKTGTILMDNEFGEKEFCEKLDSYMTA